MHKTINHNDDNDDNNNDSKITITSLKELVVVSTIIINIYSKERNKIKMPWQSAGAMTVIIAMFNVVPLLVGGIQYLGHGKPKELGLPGNEWNYRMVKRDDQYEKYAAEIRKSMDATKS